MRRTKAPLGIPPLPPKSPAERAVEIKEQLVAMANEIHSAGDSVEAYRHRREKIAGLMAQLPDDTKRDALWVWGSA